LLSPAAFGRKAFARAVLACQHGLFQAQRQLFGQLGIQAVFDHAQFEVV
jgi:hypothetical protein